MRKTLYASMCGSVLTFAALRSPSVTPPSAALHHEKRLSNFTASDKYLSRSTVRNRKDHKRYRPGRCPVFQLGLTLAVRDLKLNALIRPTVLGSSTDGKKFENAINAVGVRIAPDLGLGMRIRRQNNPGSLPPPNVPRRPQEQARQRPYHKGKRHPDKPDAPVARGDSGARIRKSNDRLRNILDYL